MTRIAFWLSAMMVTALITRTVCYVLAKDTGLTGFPSEGGLKKVNEIDVYHHP